MWEQLLAEDRIEAIQEEMAGFLLDQVIDPKGEYFYPLPPHEPLPIVIVLQRHATGSERLHVEKLCVCVYIYTYIYTYIYIYIYIYMYIIGSMRNSI